MSSSLSPLEAIFLDWEDSSESNHMNVDWAMVFDPLPDGGVPSIESFRQRILERLHLLPRFQERLSTARVGHLSRPSWVPDTSFDIARHVDADTLPAPGGERELLAWLAAFASRRLDRRHPVWQLTLLDGLSEGRWGVVFKVHHCMMDGAGGAIASVALLVDADLPPSTQKSSFQRASRASLTRRKKARRALSATRTLARMLARQPDPATGTSLDVPIGPNRHLAFVDAPIGQLAAIKNKHGGTINDVVLAATAGGLRTLLQSRGEQPLPAHLRVMVPVNMRTGQEERAITVNVSLFNVSIPLAHADPVVRYKKTVAVTKLMKQRRQAATDQRLVDLAAVIPPALQRMMMHWAHPLGHFDVMVTNVPGPGGELTVLGAPLLRVLPIVPPTMGHALNVGVFSYADSVTFGVNADPVAVPDIEVVKEGIHQTLTELHALRADASWTTQPE